MISRQAMAARRHDPARVDESAALEASWSGDTRRRPRWRRARKSQRPCLPPSPGSGSWRRSPAGRGCRGLLRAVRVICEMIVSVFRRDPPFCTAKNVMPRSRVPRMADIMTRVMPALRLRGSRKAMIPSEMASTPVSAVVPPAKARRIRNKRQRLSFVGQFESPGDRPPGPALR